MDNGLCRIIKLDHECRRTYYLVIGKSMGLSVKQYKLSRFDDCHFYTSKLNVVQMYVQ